jgi:phosphoglycerate dehydrogenase-like enzyme
MNQRQTPASAARRRHPTDVTEVLVIDWRPDEFAPLARRFPSIALRLARSIEEAEPWIGTAEVLVTVGRDLTPAAVARMPSLAWMQSLLTGVDGALAALAARPEVLLTSATGIHGPQMSEAALFHMLCLSRGVRRVMRAQERRAWDRWDPRVLDGRTVAIVGLGAVGEHLAPICRALGMTVIGISRTAREVAGVERVVPREQLAEAAAQADFLILTVPLDAGTRHLVDARVLAAMKPTAYLVNLARGAVVDTAALIDALRAGAIAGAGLDAFDEEPLPADSPLWSLDGVLITAHMAGRSDRYVERVMTILEPNLRCWLAGDRAAMRNVVAR